MSDDQKTRLNGMKCRQYYTLKIEGYERQDKKAGRQIDVENYIDLGWFSNELSQHKECTVCHTPYGCSVEDGRVLSNIT